MMYSVSEWWMWIGFGCFVLVMLVVDLVLFGGRRKREVGVREALSWVVVWVSLALFFNFLLWWYLRQTLGVELAWEKGLEFFTGYLIEESLSVDNLFVFILIFNFFAIPPAFQKRVLSLGMFGAVVLRLGMILLGIWLVSRFHWILYLFGLFLLFTGLRMLFSGDKEPQLAQNKLLKWLRRRLRITPELHAQRFFIKKAGLFYATPLFLVLVLIELSDLIFALDSIPAIFAITTDPFIVFTSNIFAIMGLRAMYFLLANLVERFTLLKYGLAVILVLIGAKMLVAYWVIIPAGITLVTVASILILCGILSWSKGAKKRVYRS